jgi:hypothetical protein
MSAVDVRVGDLSKLGYMPVLAERAVEVAARKAQGQDWRARAKMVEGFFFDGVFSQGGDVAVEGEGGKPSPVLPDAAAAGGAGGDKASPGTETAFQRARS